MRRVGRVRVSDTKINLPGDHHVSVRYRLSAIDELGSDVTIEATTTVAQAGRSILVLIGTGFEAVPRGAIQRVARNRYAVFSV